MDDAMRAGGRPTRRSGGGGQQRQATSVDGSRDSGLRQFRRQARTAGEGRCLRRRQRRQAKAAAKMGDGAIPRRQVGDGHFDDRQLPLRRPATAASTWRGHVMMLRFKVPRHQGKGTKIENNLFYVVGTTAIFLESKNSVKVRLLYQVLHRKGV